MILKILNIFKKRKNDLINIQNFSYAATYRDIERKLERLNIGEIKIKDFFKEIEAFSNYDEYNEIRKILRPLERKLKLEKLHKKF